MPERISPFSWSNWSGSQRAQFEKLALPETEAEISALVAQCAEQKKRLKIVGSGHSFSHLIADDQAILCSLKNYSGIIEIDEEERSVRVKAGTTIRDLSRALWDEGWALENLGDIEEQAVAGAISTGTHGTGIAYQNLAGFIKNLILHSPGRGREVFKREQEGFDHLAVGSFAFGVVSEYKLSIVPRYHLQLDMFPSTLSEFKEKFNDWVYNNRNSEIFWFPGTEATLIKLTNDASAQQETINSKSNFVSTYLENMAFGWVNQLNKNFPVSYPLLKWIVETFLPQTTKIDRSYLVYATERHVKFQETEYSLPISSLWSVLDDMRRVVGKKEYRTLFPVEFRFVKKDQLSLSPSHGEEDRVYIAIHTFYRDSFYRDYFKELERIFVAHGGRPHWGKMFSASKEEFARMYPRMGEVSQFRNSFDPDNLLLTKTLSDTVFNNI